LGLRRFIPFFGVILGWGPWGKVYSGSKGLGWFTKRKGLFSTRKEPQKEGFLYHWLGLSNYFTWRKFNLLRFEGFWLKGGDIILGKAFPIWGLLIRNWAGNF